MEGGLLLGREMAWPGQRVQQRKSGPIHWQVFFLDFEEYDLKVGSWSGTGRVCQMGIVGCESLETDGMLDTWTHSGRWTGRRPTSTQVRLDKDWW